MPPPALAGAGAMAQVPILRAAVARAGIQIRESSEIFLKLSMFEFELKSCGCHESYGQNMQAHPPPATPTVNDAGREGVAKLQCWGGGEVPVQASDRERPGHDRVRPKRARYR
jgi:hypothetical protein